MQRTNSRAISKLRFASCLFNIHVYSCSAQLCEHKQKLDLAYLMSYSIKVFFIVN